MLSERLSVLKQEIASYADLVTEMIDKSISGLKAGASELFSQVINIYEPRANEFDRMIDEMCASLIAQYEPLAVDLRAVLMILKMNKDLERTADHAVNICESGRALSLEKTSLSLHDIMEMAERSTEMLKESIQSFVRTDPVRAGDVRDRDGIVDRLGEKILRDMTALMGLEKGSIPAALHVMRIAHNLERIADLSANICEDVIYMAEGRDVKHRHLSSG